MAGFALGVPGTAPCNALDPLRPFRVSASYCMFSMVPLERRTLIVEGSNDGDSWRAYEVPGLPTRLDRRDGFHAPYHHSLSFLFWGSAFGSLESTVHWLPQLATALLEGRKEVCALFSCNPFSEAPPRYLRASLAVYRFADAEERRRGLYWHRTDLGLFSPVVSLENGVLKAGP